MFRGTTPEIQVLVNQDLSSWDIELDIVNGSHTYQKTGDDIRVSFDEASGETSISTTLSQEETLALEAGTMVKVQVRYARGGLAYATTIGRAPVDDIIRDGLMGGE